MDENSFSARYAYQSTEMQNLKKEILRCSKIKENSKMEEVNLMKKKYFRLMEEFKSFAFCTYSGKKHKKRCLKCIKEGEALALMCEIYEKPLPESETQRDIVVFEMCIPLEISILRDSLFVLKNFILQFASVKTMIYGYWIDYPFLKEYLKSPRPKYATLGSKNESHLIHSHNKNKHPTLPIEDFILDNKYSVHLSTLNSETRTNHIIIFSKQAYFKNKCTFETTFPYDKLMWTLQSTLHTENEVLAKQSLCPQELDKREFIKYGCFRAGERLQLKNLLASLEARELSFENINVFKLIAQSLWEMSFWEIGAEYKLSYSHADLENPIYLDHICKVLIDFLNVYKEKWNDHYVILIVIVITARLIDHAPKLELKKYMCQNIMLKCRRITKTWEQEVRKHIKEYSMRDARYEELQKMQFEIECFTILTFFVSDKYDVMTFLLSSGDDVVDWLTSIRNLNEKKYFIKELSKLLTIRIINCI